MVGSVCGDGVYDSDRFYDSDGFYDDDASLTVTASSNTQVKNCSPAD